MISTCGQRRHQTWYGADTESEPSTSNRWSSCWRGPLAPVRPAADKAQRLRQLGSTGLHPAERVDSVGEELRTSSEGAALVEGFASASIQGALMQDT